MSDKPKPRTVTFREMLELAVVGVKRDLAFSECSELLGGWGHDAAGVELNDGRLLLCRAEENGFGGSDVTPPDPPEVAYYVVAGSRSEDDDDMSDTPDSTARRPSEAGDAGQPQWICKHTRNHGPGITWPCNTICEADESSCPACGEPRPASSYIVNAGGAALTDRGLRGRTA